MSDVFEEVEEQLRAERYKAIALKAMPWVAGGLGILLAVMLSVWGFQTYRTNASNKASESYAEAMAAINAGQRDTAVSLFAEIAKSPSRPYKSLALQHLGGFKLADGKVDEAVKLFDQAAAAAPNNMTGDIARLKSAFALLDTAPYKDLEARLTPLTQDGRPYRAQAREALAFAKLMAGDAKGARSDFVVLSLLPDMNEQAEARAQAAIALIDSGAAAQIPTVVKAAAALPPPIQLPPGAQIPGLQGPPQAQAAQ